MTRLFRSRGAAAAGCLALALAGIACDVNLGNGDFSLGLASGQSTDTWTRTYTVAAGGRFEVVNVNGLVQVEAGTGPAIEIRAERRAKASSDEAAKDLLGKVQMLEDVKPDAVRLEAKPPKTIRGGVDIKFFVKVPAGVNVVARTVNGGIKLMSVPNDVEASTTNGGVEADQVSGTLRVSTTNGGVRLALEWSGQRRLAGPDGQRRSQRRIAEGCQRQPLRARRQRRAGGGQPAARDARRADAPATRR